MAYNLKELTIRTNNEPKGIQTINEVWRDIQTGKIPLIFDSDHMLLKGISLVSRYSNYSSDEDGDYDLTIMSVTSEFFRKMDLAVSKGLYKKYDEQDEHGKVEMCTKKAWEKVWSDNKSGVIQRTFTQDFESTVPSEYTKDKKAHCYLYIAVQ